MKIDEQIKSLETRRFRELNEKYNLHLRNESLPFKDGIQELGWFDYDEQSLKLSIQIIHLNNDKKDNLNLTKLLQCPIEYMTTKQFKNDNYIIIYHHYLQNETKYKNLCERRGLNLVYTYSTSEYLTVDIDTEEDLGKPFVRRLLLKYPFYISMKKRIFKIIIPRNKEIMPPELFNCPFKPVLDGYVKTEILGKGNMSYVPIEGQLYNCDFTLDMMKKDDFRDCPLQPIPEKPKTTDKRKRESFSAIKDTEMDMMLDFIQKCSLKEYPNQPNHRVGSVYHGEGNTCWLKICRAIKDWNDTHIGFQKLHNFSKLTPNYDVKKWIKGGQSEKDWSSCDTMTVNVGYIVNLYHEFREKFPPSSLIQASNYQEELLLKIMDTFELNHLQISQLFLTFPSFKNRYKYCNLTDNWYEVLEDNLWIKRKKIYITKFIQDEFLPFLQTVIQKTTDKDALKILFKLRDKVGFVDFQSGIFKNATPYLQENDFFTKLDRNVNLLSFENGVFDMSTKSFRPREYDDFISLSTQTNYTQDIPQDAKEFFEKFIRTICMTHTQEQNNTQKNEIYTFFCKIMCLFLFGSNVSNSVVIFTGEGGNGKSRLFKLHTLGLGQYIRKLEPTYFTSVKTANHGTSPLSACQGLRLVYTSEPDDTQKLQGPLIKDISGNEPMNVRALYKNDFQLFVQFVLYFQTNNMPLISNSGDENSLLRRLIIFDFPNIFKNKEDCDEENPSNRVKQDKLDLEIEKYSEYWASYLVQMFVTYHGTVYPEKNLTPFLASSKFLVKEYLGESNTVLTFIEQHYIPMDLTPENQKNYKISPETLVRLYNECHKNSPISSAKKFGKLLCKIPCYKKCQFKSSSTYYCLKERPYDYEGGETEVSPYPLPL